MKANVGNPEFDERYVLDRREAVPALVGGHKEFLFIAGLAGTARDVTSLVNDGPSAYGLGGAMGAATMMGLGLALARPDRTVIAFCGDGELLMNVGSLATIGVRNPPNLRIVCVDNGHYGETGYQRSHTSLGVDLEKIAVGSGIRRTLTIGTAAELPKGSKLLRESEDAVFILMRVKPTDPPKFKRTLDPAVCRVRFKAALADAARAGG
ncbi:thiamine pyrophosphate-binding protein (plasmid) [Bradyrhizobium sp. CCBAU 53351]|nr:thiamine pyrophosphate-binding protein [Bradyrhizobium guangdongense]QAU51189.1 thiamine pyrophosphate-binding protein [Bradyrhizobium guangzhouense]QOZ49835.1 thiamine pyrophosphate-binding protein [Bradyrhizobium sp. CCBAU 53340]QOZ57281.1 thiamine pyrophosphate-binding protein [Bradyrhizobium sp. CCBAU 53338]QOZ81528.1 thiamine pyrophosphate-binding protein [Bradyrhizobium sp. CCBAU 53351]